ncbi:MAG: hypothetical protein WAS07_01850 [Micropruina sp.]
MRPRNLIALVAGLALTLALGLSAAPTHAAPRDDAAEHARIVNFWTKERVAKAQPRDFVRQGDGTFKPSAKPSKPGGTTTGVLGADWTGGGVVQENTGKVLFAMGTSYYVCSASVVVDTSSTTSTIATAAHCVYDEANEAFATNWMFIPDYDSNPVSLTTSGSFCAETVYGCWSARALTVASGFATAGGFNDQAILHDYAFATVASGGHNKTTQLDATVGTQQIAFNTGTLDASAWLFGYPASGKYRGTKLIYSMGPLGTDSLNSNLTYRVASNMTPGCSGGPWFQSFGAGSGGGVLISVNSYSYSGSSFMHGPKFNAETEDLYLEANGATANKII